MSVGLKFQRARVGLWDEALKFLDFFALFDQAKRAEKSALLHKFTANLFEGRQG